jgi:lipopolysaccharide transport system ATP-binding protein
MAETTVKVENVSKRYRLGIIGHGTLYKDLQSWWARIRGKEDPNEIIDEQGGPALNGQRFWALRNVSFEVRQGEVFGIIGENGAGKTTLLKILSRVTAPTEGQIHVVGRVASLLEVGTGFHPELTGRENVFLNAAILGMSNAQIRSKFDEIVAYSGIEKFIDTPVKRYSSGMYVRLAFSVAAHLDPEVLIIDEILQVGDADFQKKCFEKMSSFGKEGRTVILVSHNMSTITDLCRRAILLRQGQIVCEGPSEKVIEAYLPPPKEPETGEIVWDDIENAPGNDIVRLKAIRVLQDGIDGPAEYVDMSKEIEIHIEYWNLKAGESLYPVVWLRDKSGTIVLTTNNDKLVSLTIDDWNGRPYPCGLFMSICRIPGNFLNEGSYSIAASIGNKRGLKAEIFEDKALSFFVRYTDEVKKQGYNKRLGIVTPRLGWSTEHLK